MHGRFAKDNHVLKQAQYLRLTRLLKRPEELYRKMRKNSSADLRGSRNKSEITATESAPASIIEAAFPRVIPPIATRGLRVRLRTRRTPSRPTTGSGFCLLEVAKTGPIAT